MKNRIKIVFKNFLRWLNGKPIELDLDVIIKKYIQKFKKSNFIVIGANDASDNDIIKAALNNLEGFGILVEPQPFVYEKLYNNFKNKKNFYLINAAIDDRTGKQKLYALDFGNNRWSTGLTSFSKEVLLKHFQNGYIQKCAQQEGIQIDNNFDIYIQSYDVKTYKIHDLISELGVSFPELVFIDTEGHDFEIIKTFDITDDCPAIVFFEHLHLSNSDYKSCIDLFRKNNYKVFFKGRDTLAIAKNVWRNLGYLQ